MNNNNGLLTDIQVKKEITDEEEQIAQKNLQFSKVFIKEEKYTDESINSGFIDSEKVDTVEDYSYNYRNKLQECQPYCIKKVSDNKDLCDSKINIGSLITNCTGETTLQDENNEAVLKRDFNGDILVTRSIKEEAVPIRDVEGNPEQSENSDKSFWVKSESSAHVATNDSAKKYNCSICNGSFGHMYDLSKHLIIHNNKQFTCEMCNKNFKAKWNIKKHIEKHENVNTCNVCHRSFYNRGHLTLHMNTHIQDKKHKCKICGALFRRECDVVKHLLFHRSREDKKFTCNVCSASFFSIGHLNAHLKSHETKTANFVCYVCHKSFSQGYILTNHLLTHSEVKTFKCNICNTLFLTKGYLDRHSQVHK